MSQLYSLQITVNHLYKAWSFGVAERSILGFIISSIEFVMYINTYKIYHYDYDVFSGVDYTIHNLGRN